MTGRGGRVLLAVAAGIAATITVAMLPQSSGEVERRQSEVPFASDAPSPDIAVVLAEHRALGTRNVGRSDERLARLDADVARERREARTAEIHAAADQRRAEQLAAVEARREEERRAAEEAARKAAEEEVAREAAAKATPAPKATTAPAEPGASVVLPLASYRISSPFGTRVHPITGARKLHSGTDFAAPQGSAVRSIAAGRIVSATYDGAWGNRIVIDHGDYVTWYCHLSSFDRTGGTVAAGEVIGRVGTTGLSTGPHLHHEVHINGSPVDPAQFLRNRGATP